MVEMIANRQLVGDYGRVEPHSIFRCTDEVADSLERRGLARRLTTVITETVKAPKPDKSTVERIQAAVEKEVAPEPKAEPEPKKPAPKKKKASKRRKK